MRYNVRMIWDKKCACCGGWLPRFQMKVRTNFVLCRVCAKLLSDYPLSMPISLRMEKVRALV